jgi:hypothetical protein
MHVFGYGRIPTEYSIDLPPVYALIRASASIHRHEAGADAYQR